MPSVVVDGDKVQTSGNKDTLGNTMAKIYDLENEINDAVDMYVDRKCHIVSQIEGILTKNTTNRGEEMYDVLTAKFVRCLDFEDIPEEVGMSRSKMFYIYNEALKEFEKLYGKEYMQVCTDLD